LKKVDATMETLDQVAARWQLATVVRARGSARTYASRLARFETWCRTQGRCWCPADVETVRAFLEALGEAGVQPQLSMSFVQAINAGHRALGLPQPLPLQRSAVRPRGGGGPAVDERYLRAAERMLDPGWRPAHLAAPPAPTPPGDGLPTPTQGQAPRREAGLAPGGVELTEVLVLVEGAELVAQPRDHGALGEGGTGDARGLGGDPADRLRT
jgi:hypothetical protein